MTADSESQDYGLPASSSSLLDTPPHLTLPPDCCHHSRGNSYLFCYGQRQGRVLGNDFVSIKNKILPVSASLVLGLKVPATLPSRVCYT